MSPRLGQHGINSIWCESVRNNMIKASGTLLFWKIGEPSLSENNSNKGVWKFSRVEQNCFLILCNAEDWKEHIFHFRNRIFIAQGFVDLIHWRQSVFSKVQGTVSLPPCFPACGQGLHMNRLWEWGTFSSVSLEGSGCDSSGDVVLFLIDHCD